MSDEACRRRGDAGRRLARQASVSTSLEPLVCRAHAAPSQNEPAEPRRKVQLTGTRLVRSCRG